MITEYRTCFFTGHRVIDAEKYETVKSYLREEILNKINMGVTDFIAGGAMGFDALAAEQVIDMRVDYNMIRLILFLPCRDHDAAWKAQDRTRNAFIYSMADKIFYVTDGEYQKGCMKKRNRAMVAASDCGIAYMNRRRSGTFQTVKTAYEKGINVVNLADL